VFRPIERVNIARSEGRDRVWWAAINGLQPYIGSAVGVVDEADRIAFRSPAQTCVRFRVGCRSVGPQRLAALRRKNRQLPARITSRWTVPGGYLVVDGGNRRMHY